MYGLDMRCQKLLQKLVMSEDYLQIKDIAQDYQISRRSVYYDICKINDYLEEHCISPIIINRSLGIFLNINQKQMIHQLLNENNKNKTAFYSPMERIKIIICTLIIKKQPIYIDNLIQICQVSRNTIINDLKVVVSKLNEFELRLNYENKNGYVIEGNVIKKRALFFLYFPDLVNFYKVNLETNDTQQDILNNLEKLSYIEKTLDTQYVEETLLAIAYFITFLKDDDETLSFSDIDKNKIMESYEYTLVNKVFNTLSEDSKLYLTLHLLGSRLQTLPFDIMNIDENQEPYILAKALVSEFMKLACLQFEHPEDVERSLFVHLKSSLYRYRYGIQLGNPLIEDVRMQYPELFQITKRTVEYVVQQIKVPINDNEIAYLTLHFGSFITLNQANESMFILIVCPNGISTGNMLKGEVMALVPYANKIDVISLSELAKVKIKYDVVISTVVLKNVNNSILVHPILTETDRVAILKRCIRTTIKQQIKYEDIMNIVSKYVMKENIEILEKELKKYFNQSNQVEFYPLKATNGGILHYLKVDAIQIENKDMDWQAAIHYASNPLLIQKRIEVQYIEAIIQQTRKLGPYMFINKQVVLAHAKPEEGVHELGFAMSIFNKEILFPKQRSANIIIVLAAEDQVKHLKILSDIMILFKDNDTVNEIMTKQTKHEILEYIKFKLKDK